MPTPRLFLEKLRAFAVLLPAEFVFAVEVRNPQYLNAAFFALLAETGLRPVLQQGYWMPPIAEVYDVWCDEIARHDVVVIRLHGPDRQAIEKETAHRWDRIVQPREAELAAAVRITRDLLARGITVFVNVNNHFEGSAPLTIRRFRALAAAQGLPG